MRLYHRDRLLGEISDPFPDEPWLWGTIALSPEAEPYIPFFAFMVDDTNGWQEPPFGQDLLDPQWWSIEEGGQRRGIEVPAVYADGTIAWVWR